MCFIYASPKEGINPPEEKQLHPARRRLERIIDLLL